MPIAELNEGRTLKWIGDRGCCFTPIWRDTANNPSFDAPEAVGRVNEGAIILSMSPYSKFWRHMFAFWRFAIKPSAILFAQPRPDRPGLG